MFIMNFKKFLVYLSKKISRKNLISFLEKDLSNIKNSGKKISLLNVGSGGEIEKSIKKYNFFNVKSIDIDHLRKPDQELDVCDYDFEKKLGHTVNCIVISEVIEHLKDPFLAIHNLKKVLEKDGFMIVTSPFILGIHDEPNDYFRYTKHGLKLLLKDFKIINLKQRNNGLMDIIFILLIRSFQDKKFINKAFGSAVLIIYYLLYPIIYFLNIFLKSEKITTGYYVLAVKK